MPAGSPRWSGSFLLFGFLTVLTFNQQLQKLFEGG